MLDRLALLVLAGVVVLFAYAPPAAAQASNLDTVEGPRGETTVLTMTPHALTDEVSARALGTESPGGTRWAITLIGISSADSLGLSLGEEALPIEEINRPGEDEVGPTRLYVSGETFLTIAEAAAVRLHVGDTTTGFPEQMRQEMQLIYNRVK